MAKKGLAKLKGSDIHSILSYQISYESQEQVQS